MSYTLKVVRIKQRDWSEETVYTRTQTVNISGMARPNSEKREFLLILKGNEVLLFDRYGSLRYVRTFPSSISHASVNENGYAVVAYDSTIALLSPTGETLFTTTLPTSVFRVACGNQYFWVVLSNDPVSIYCYDFSLSLIGTISIDLRSANNIMISIDKSGSNAIIFTHDGDNNYRWRHYSLTSLVRSVTFENVTWATRSFVSHCSSNFVIHLLGLVHAYTRFMALRNDPITIIAEPWSSGTDQWCGGVSANGDVLWYGRGGTATVRIRRIDVNQARVIGSIDVTLSENLEATTIEMAGDMTPDGRYAIVQTTNRIHIIDTTSGVVVKSITKSFANAAVRVVPLLIGG